MHLIFLSKICIGIIFIIVSSFVIIDVSLKDNDLRKASPYISNKDYYKLNMISLQEILQIIDIIEQGLQKNKKIFLFCNSGFYYTSFIVACYFIKYAKLNKFNVNKEYKFQKFYFI